MEASLTTTPVYCIAVTDVRGHVDVFVHGGRPLRDQAGVEHVVLASDVLPPWAERRMCTVTCGELDSSGVASRRADGRWWISLVRPWRRSEDDL